MTYKRFSADLIHLDTVDSTNNYAANLLKTTKVTNGTVVMTKRQTSGKGQRGNSWLSEENKNLTFSLIIFPDLPAKHAHFIAIAASLALQKSISEALKKVKIKWPNDILVDRKKIAGILVENQIRGELISSSVVGIGINVNQIEFAKELAATSYVKENVQEQNLEDLFKKIYLNLDFYFDHLLNKNFKLLVSRYYEVLYGYNEINRFENGDEIFDALLVGIDEVGKLILKRKNRNQHFDIKEVRLHLN